MRTRKLAVAIAGAASLAIIPASGAFGVTHHAVTPHATFVCFPTSGGAPGTGGQPNGGTGGVGTSGGTFCFSTFGGGGMPPG